MPRRPTKPHNSIVRRAVAYVVEELEQRKLLSAGTPGGSIHDPTGVSSKLIQLAQAGRSANARPDQLPFMFDSDGRVGVRITATDVDALTSSLAGLGFQPDASLPDRHLVEGYLPLSSVASMNDLASQGMLGVMPLLKPITSVGAVTSQGDAILEASRTRTATGNTGAGVTVGVLSDSYNNLGTAANGVASGDLPNNVNVLQDIPSGGTDEGRGMMEIVHDLAPGSNLAFATADTGEAGFAQNILNLAKPVAQGGAGAQVITDDITYFDEPYFQDGIVAQAVNTVVTNSGISYFAAAGNIDTQSYESTNVNFITDTIPSLYATPQKYYNFNPGGVATDKQSFSLTNNQAVIMGLQWNQPFYTASSVTSDLDFFILNHNTGALVAAGAADNLASQSPVELMQFQNTTGATATFDVVINLFAGPTPTRLKYVNFGANEFGDVSFAFATNSNTMNPHAASANAMAVAASSIYDNKNPEAFTSSGPTTVLFNPNGTPLGSAQVRAKPDITAIDGGDTTFFGGDVDGNGGHNFFGTSAAAPHAAAIAALIKAAHPAFTPAQIYSTLKTTADPNIGSVPNVNLIGAGEVNAYLALVGAPAPASLPVNDGLESGVLAQDWQVYNSGAGRTQVLNTLTPQTGSFHLVMDGTITASASQAFTVPQLEEAILHVDLAGASNVMLSFGKKSFFDGFGLESTQTMPATFSGHGNFDGVAMSVDGVNWKLVQTLTAATNSTYSTFNLNLSTIAAAAGVTLTSDTLIKFQHYDPNTNSAPNTGFAFDNISVTGTVGGGSIAGQLFQDNNGDGFLTAEPTLNGVVVYLDNNNNGTLDGGDVSTATAGSGNYSFGSLAPGVYHVRAAVPGYIQSSPPANPVVTSGPMTVDIGEFPITFPVAPATGSGSDNYTLSLDASGQNVQISDGSTTYSINRLVLAPYTLTFNGNASDDSLTINTANGSPLVNVAGVTFDGGASSGGDALIVNGASGSDAFTLDASSATLNGSLINFSNLESYTFNGNLGGDNVTVDANTLNFNATQVLTSLALLDHTTARLTPGANKVLTLTNFSIATTAMLDFTDNDGIIRNGSTVLIQQLLASGYHQGAWDGVYFNSSTAAAVAANAGNIHKTALGWSLASNTPLGSPFDGQTLNNNDIVIRYTDSGDANLDGNTNTLDFMRLSFNFNGAGKVWSQGDFSFNSAVNALDFNAIATNYGQTLPAPPFSESQIPVPSSVDETPVNRYKLGLWDRGPAAMDEADRDPLAELTA